MDDKPGAPPVGSVESRHAPTSLVRRLLSWQWVAFTLVVVLAVAAFLFLAWWQLGRFESRSGDWQNFGYALQWPFFAVFAVYVWWRLLRESRRDDGRPGPESDAVRGADRRADDELTELPPLPPKRLVRPDGAGVRSAQGAGAANPNGRAGTAEPTGSTGSADPDAAEDGTDEAALTAYNRYLAALQERSTGAGRTAGHSDGRPPG